MWEPKYPIVKQVFSIAAMWGKNYTLLKIGISQILPTLGVYIIIQMAIFFQ